MATANPLETCPSCEIGTLVRAEGATEGRINYFSCGHTSKDSIVHVTGSEAKFFIGRLGVEHRLGPHSAKAISHTRGVTVDAFVVSMQQEMYKDAIHFMHEARRHHGISEHDPFTVWRNVRAAILFSFAAIECCVNQFIDEHVEHNRAKMSPTEIDRWTEKKGFLGIKKKLNKGIELFGGKRLDADKPLWSSFEDLRLLRDGLVHYKIKNRLPYDTDELLERTTKGIKTASDVIKKIYLAYPTNKTYPEIFDKLP
jgi:hypothetical protein